MFRRLGFAIVIAISAAFVRHVGSNVRAQLRVDPDPIDAVLGEAWEAPGVAPPRVQLGEMRRVSAISTRELWTLLERQDPAHRQLFVTLKNAAQTRGYFRGRLLMSPAEFEKAKRILLKSIPGIREDRDLGRIQLANRVQLPGFYAIVNSAETLAKLRQWPTLDYAEPAFMYFDSLACGFDAYSPSADPRATDDTVPGINGGTDLVPYVYRHHNVQSAWRRVSATAASTPGQEEGIAVLDSGVSTQQEQFFGRYSLFQARRPHLRLNATSQTIDDACFHGTKLASVAAAPRDGQSIVGIAWNSPLTTVKINHSPATTKGSVGAICQGISDAVTPPDGRPPARVLTMAFGLIYWSDTVAECITTAFQSSPSTIFVAAAGSNVTNVVFPANMNDFVVAVSMVELSPTGTGFRLFGRPFTVSYGPEVDFVSVNGPDGMPASGLIGNAQSDQIARFKWSSAATGVYAGIVALAGQYASQRNWTRAQLIAALEQSATRANITDFSGEPLQAIVGWGIVDAYRATGGARTATITAPYQVSPGQQFTVVGTTDAVQPFNATAPPHFRYEWSINGSQVGTNETITLKAPTSGMMDIRLTVSDTVDQTSHSASHRVSVVPTVPPPISRRLFSASYVADWATFFNGGRHDRLINSNQTMPQGCVVQNVLGLLMCEASGQVTPCPGEIPSRSADRTSRGFSVSRPPGLSANNLEVQVHQWHDGLSAVRTKAVYDILQPAGVECVVENVLSTVP